jgi:hypothetical protein
VALFPALYAAWLASSAGVLPDDDYWYILERISDADGRLLPSLRSWFVRANEHLVGGAGVLFAANVDMFAGSNRSLAALTWLIVLGQVPLLLWVASPILRGRGWTPALAAVSVGALLCTPSAHFNWFRGHSGIEWGLGQLFAVASIVGFEVHLRTRRLPPLLLSMCLALAGVWTFTVAVSVVPALVVGSRWGRRSARLATVGLGAVVVGVSMWAYSPQAHHPSPTSGTLFQAAAFPAVYLGSLFTEGYRHLDLAIAALAGVGGVGAAGWAIVRLGRQRSLEQARPLLMLLTFAVSNAVLASIFRVGFGVGMAASSRYHFVAGLFWACVVLLMLMAQLGRPVVRCLLIAVLIAAPYLTSWPAVEAGRAREAGKAELASKITEGRIDEGELRESLTSSPEVFERVLPRLAPMGHVPFGDGQP